MQIFLLGTEPNAPVVTCKDTEHWQQMTVWCADDCGSDLGHYEMDLADPARALAGQYLVELAKLAQLRMPTWLRANQLAVDMRQFCRLVVPHLTNAKVLEFHLCRSLSGGDIAMLSAALTRHGVQLEQLLLRVCDDDDVCVAIAALCDSQTSLLQLGLEGLDDARCDAVGGQPFPLIKSLMRPGAPTRLRIVGLEQTRVPTAAELLVMQPLDAASLHRTEFFLANRLFAPLIAVE